MIGFRLGQSNPSVIKGVGMIAKIVSDRSGVIWWVKKHNQLQSVWFMASKTFLFGTNLSGKNLTEILHEGESVQLTSMLVKKYLEDVFGFLKAY